MSIIMHCLLTLTFTPTQTIRPLQQNLLVWSVTFLLLWENIKEKHPKHYLIASALSKQFNLDKVYW